MTYEEYQAIKFLVIQEGRAVVAAGSRACGCNGDGTCQVCGGDGHFEYVVGAKPGEGSTEELVYIPIGQCVNVWHGTKYLRCYFIGDLKNDDGKYKPVGPFADLEVMEWNPTSDLR